MMAIANNFSISPYLPLNATNAWLEFRKWMQHQTRLQLQLRKHNTGIGFKRDLKSGRLALVYAGPSHAAMLSKQFNYQPVARALGQYDEALIAVRADSNLFDVEQIKSKMYLSVSIDPMVRLHGRILLQPAHVDESNLICRHHLSPKSLVADLHGNKMDACLISSKQFDCLPAEQRTDLRILCRSQAYLFSHIWMLNAQHADQYSVLRQAFKLMRSDKRGAAILKKLSVQDWMNVESKEMEKMIGLLETFR
jgi:ABC-type phosphate/phosphonate transport system substrate-binding protein